MRFRTNIRHLTTYTSSPLSALTPYLISQDETKLTTKLAYFCLEHFGAVLSTLPNLTPLNDCLKPQKPP